MGQGTRQLIFRRTNMEQKVIGSREVMHKIINIDNSIIVFKLIKRLTGI